MSTARQLKGLAAISGIALILLSLMTSPSQAQDAQPHLTIADCPAGSVLGIQDTAEAQPVTKSPATNTTQTTDPNADATAAPRSFVTGCVPMNTAAPERRGE
jgi:hypothetical protein